MPITEIATSVRAALRAGALALAALGAAPAAAQEAWPTEPVHLVVAYGPGGVSDIAARLLSEHLEAAFGQRFVVDNKPGAGGTVAAQAVLEGGPEGYYFLNVGASGTIKRTLLPNQPIDQIGDFEPVSPVANFGLVVVAAPGSDFTSVQDVLEFAKSDPGALNIGTVSVGSTQYLAAKLFASVAGIEAEVIPFNSSPELMGAVARGEVDVAFEIMAGAKAAVDAGQVTPIATTMAQRSRLFPDVPTVEESGVAPYDVSSWNAYSAPKGIDPAIVERMNAEIQKIIQMPEVEEKLLAVGAEPYLGTAQDIKDRQDKDTETWREVIVAAGVPIEG
ncbi:Bug family tripartite tricarboxylate transporter substrate binding protein [Salipiger sp.]|uniref:Bug family tripartite tricarboxylate transporter substrate binding protein n=1 Tax=Salipiger sp. TaxID=2078585 RepID=UPI003A97F44B